jgi:hypothetical protein
MFFEISYIIYTFLIVCVFNVFIGYYLAKKDKHKANTVINTVGNYRYY